MNTHCLNDKFEVYHIKSGKPKVPGTAIIKHASEDDSECIVHLFTPSGSFLESNDFGKTQKFNSLQNR